MEPGLNLLTVEVAIRLRIVRGLRLPVVERYDHPRLGEIAKRQNELWKAMGAPRSEVS